MYVDEISLKNFRNIKSGNIGPFSKNINLIVGRNGSGKTNMLEAIGLSAIAKSCRGSRTQEMIAFEAETALVEVSGVSQKKKPR